MSYRQHIDALDHSSPVDMTVGYFRNSCDLAAARIAYHASQSRLTADELYEIMVNCFSREEDEKWKVTAEEQRVRMNDRTNTPWSSRVSTHSDSRRH